MAQSSKPTAEAVIARYMISIKTGVESGNCIFSEENPKPANIAAIPLTEKNKRSKSKIGLT
jgi:hypothetical protein